MPAFHPPAGAQSQTGARIGLGHIRHRRAMLPSCRLRDQELAASPEHHLGSRPGSLPGLRLRKTAVGVEERAGLLRRKDASERNKSIREGRGGDEAGGSIGKPAGAVEMD